MIALGELRLHLINDCHTWADAGGAFGLVPRALYQSFMQPDADNLVPMSHHNLLVEAGGRKMIVDTGYGDKLPAKQRSVLRHEQPTGGLTAGLARLGVTPDQIDLVILTHLHGDHSGGATRHDEAGAPVPTFPNAEYVVQRREYEDAMRPNERTRATYILANYQPLMERGQLTLLDGDTTFAAGVKGIVTPGHTPGHMSIRFEGGGQHAAFVCDLATYSIHFERLGWMTAYDVEPLITLETKRVWQTWALETNALLIFPHDPLRPAARLREDANGTRRLEAVDVVFA